MAGWFVSGRNNRKLKREGCESEQAIVFGREDNLFLSFSRSVIPRECKSSTKYIQGQMEGAGAVL